MLAFLALFLFAPGITTIAAFDRDESRFAQASRQMLEQHDFSRVHVQEHARHLKPPGIYWLQAGATHAFRFFYQNSIATYRVVSVLGGMLAVCFLFAFFASDLGIVTAFTAALALATSLLLVVEAHMAVTDAFLLACIVFMQGCLWRAYTAYREGRSIPSKAAYGFWIGMGLGLAIKGTAPIVGLLSLLGLALFERSSVFVRRLHLFSGMLLVLLLTLAWAVPVSLASHSNFFWDMIRQDALPKVLGSHQGHGKPPGYFLILLPALFLPSALFVLPALGKAWREREKPLVRFLWAWILPSWIFIELIHTKLPQYLLPVLPALALLVAIFLKEGYSGSNAFKVCYRIYCGFWLLLMLLFALALPIVSYYLLGQVSVVPVLCGIIIFIGAVLALFSVAQEKNQRAFYQLAAAAILFYGLIFGFFLPSLKPLWVAPRIAAKLEQDARALGASVATLPLYDAAFHEPSLVFYVGSRRVRYTSLSALTKLCRPSFRAYVLLRNRDVSRFRQDCFSKQPRFLRVGAVSGFNYERGHRVHYSLLRLGV